MKRPQRNLTIIMSVLVGVYLLLTRLPPLAALALLGLLLLFLLGAAFFGRDLLSETQWQPLAARARGRVFRRSFAIWALIIVLVALLLRDARVASLLCLALPLSWWYATNYTRFTRWALKQDVLLFREGWLKRTLVIVPRNRVQCALYEASPFDRRHRMAGVVIDTAGGGRDTVRIPYLDTHVAAALARALYLSSAGAQYADHQELEPEAV